MGAVVEEEELGVRQGDYILHTQCSQEERWPSHTTYCIHNFLA